MDSSKAFDMVDHTELLTALHDLDLEPHLWQLYYDMYSQVISRVRVNGLLSREIQESRGIRQGGETSTEGFKAKENPFLHKIRLHPKSLHIGCIPMGIPTVADDNCMLARTREGAQTQLLLAQQNAAKVRYVFSTAKSKVMYLQSSSCSQLAKQETFMFNNSDIDSSEKETDLGLSRTADGRTTEAVRDMIQVGMRTAYALMGAGMHGVNGLPPSTTRLIVATYINPVILYGLEALVLEEQDMQQLDQYHRRLLRQLQSLLDSTAKPAIYLLMGCLPMRAYLHQNILSLFCTVLHRPGSPEYEIIVRQLTIKDLNSHSWTVQLRKILHKYNLPMALQLVNNPPRKEKWKTQVKQAIQSYWEKLIKEEASGMKSLKYLNLNACGPGFTHFVWETGADPIQTVMAAVKSSLLIGRYPLTGHKCAGKRQQPKCPQCGTEPETIDHFLIRCPMYDDMRKTYIDRIIEEPILNNINLDDTEMLVHLILDPSHFITDLQTVLKIESVTRRMCFSFHNRRALNEGWGSMYQWASKRVKV